MTPFLRTLPRRLRATALAAAGSLAAGAALAHPGHGAAPFHGHGELALAALALAGVAGGLALQQAGRQRAAAALQAWGWRLAAGGCLGLLALLAARG